MEGENTMNFDSPPGMLWNETSTDLHFSDLNNILISHLCFSRTSILIANI